MTPNDNAQKVADTESLFAAVKRLGLRSPVFLDGYRVSFPEAEVMKLAATVEALAEALRPMTEGTAWLTGVQVSAARAALARYEGTPNAD